MPPSPPSPFQEPFIRTLDEASHLNHRDDPSYYAKYPRSLISQSAVSSFTTGTGDSIYKSLAPLLESTNHELILVTCFWAKSSTLDTLNNALLKLSEKAIYRGESKIRVRLCFSSSSLLQKLFHRQDVHGQVWGESTWVRELGLPDPRELGGIDLEVKSVFMLPFSVMHPKFVVVDRRAVVLPSCNVSWEAWFEGCVTFSGPLVRQFVGFYEAFWKREELPELPATTPEEESLWQPTVAEAEQEIQDFGHGHITRSFPSTSTTSKPSATATDSIPAIFLPSPHRRNPNFRPFGLAHAPPTPLNAFILTLLAEAKSYIRIQTPNLTSPPVLRGILAALARGVDVQILTSQRLMVLEQLVTAGTTTARCITRLVKRYEGLRRSLKGPERRPETGDEEAAIALPMPKPGRLRISYFAPLGGAKGRGKEDGEPQQSHLKMTVADGEVVVLGSGNLDRASWFTSQELGVAFFDAALVKEVESVLDRAMEGRHKAVYDSGAEAGS